jgi:predicted small lipoprotein YifL
MPPSRQHVVLRALVLATALAASMAGCGSTGPAMPSAAAGALASAPASVGASESAAFDPQPTAASGDPFVAWPAFAACLRAHGLDVADPELDAAGEPHWGDDLKRSLTQPVRAACSPIIAVVDEGGTLRGHGVPSYSFDSLVAHAACVRAHGLSEWPDPDANATNWVWPPSFGRTDPAVLTAIDACESALVQATATP